VAWAGPPNKAEVRVLFKQRFWEGLADGSITLAFRRWRRPTVRPGGTLRTPGGVLRIDDVRTTTVGAISAGDAARAGYVSRSELVDELSRHSDRDLYRIEFHWAGEDPRLKLRRSDRLDAGDLTDLRQHLARLDGASRHGPWTVATLRLIAERPGVRAADLAAVRNEEKLVFKRDVRKLKELGLTESLEIGYRLSPRGRALLRHLQ
jgi:hypothetical protein